MKRILFFFTSFLFLGILVQGQVQATDNKYLQEFEAKVTEFSLDNGFKFLVIERHQVPTASFVNFVDAGSVNEPAGNTGIAHLLEHMAFKGTPTIGTTNWEKEKPLLKKINKVYTEWLQAKSEHPLDQKDISNKRARFEKLQDKAQKYVKANEFSKIIERNGGTDLNAGTSKDYTIYFCSLPANRAELWFSLESDRLKNPVWREFYTEKQVIMEERRMRVESQPTGYLIEQLLAHSFIAHPYRHPVLGWKSDIIATTVSDLERFYQRYYIPRNITFAIAGDVDPMQIKKWAQTYFGQFESRSSQVKNITEEPKQEDERSFNISKFSQPYYIRAYHIPKQMDKDYPALKLLSQILSEGRTSRFYSQLVVKEEIASQIHAMTGFPGEKYPCLLVIFAVPYKDINLSSLAKEIDSVLDEVKEEGVTERELKRAQKNALADLIRGLDSNLGLAKSFSKAEVQMGDWRKVFTKIELLEKVTLADIKRVANKYLKSNNKTVGKIINHKQE